MGVAARGGPFTKQLLTAQTAANTTATWIWVGDLKDIAVHVKDLGTGIVQAWSSDFPQDPTTPPSNAIPITATVGVKIGADFTTAEIRSIRGSGAVDTGPILWLTLIKSSTGDSTATNAMLVGHFR